MTPFASLRNPSPSLVSKLRTTLIAGASAMLLSSSALAQNQALCPSLLQAKRALEARKAELIVRYPGTAGVLFICAVIASQQPGADREKTLLACAGMSCLFAMSTCMEVIGEVMSLVLQMQELERQITANRC